MLVLLTLGDEIIVQGLQLIYFEPDHSCQIYLEVVPAILSAKFCTVAPDFPPNSFLGNYMYLKIKAVSHQGTSI